jgi:hypothetical protein
MTARSRLLTSHRLAVVVLLSAALLASCGRSATPTLAPPTPEPTEVATGVSGGQPQPTDTQALPTQPLVTPTAVPPTSTPSVPMAPPPTSSLPPQIKRIEFAPGATWAIVQGSLAGGGIDEYLLHALAGQSMMVIVTSPDNSVVLEIYGVSDGQPLLRGDMRQMSAQVVLLATQDYDIKTISTGGATTFTLQVIIPPLATPPLPPATPVTPQVKRIEFASDATSAMEQGTLAAEGIDEYVLRALAGQWLMAMVSSPDDSVVLQMWGSNDGQPLVRSDMRQTFWQGTLPATQDYGVKAVSTAAETSYILLIIIPERVQFAPGAISATDQGSLAPHETHEYLLRALQGQTMTVTILSPSDLVLLEIYGIDDGQPLVRVPMGQTTWTGALANTQDYDIKAVSVTDVTTTYSIEFIVQ